MKLESAGASLNLLDEACWRACIAFAEKMDPLWRVSAIFVRLQTERCLGPRMVSRLRQRYRRLVKRDTKDGRIGTIFGWWPVDP